MSKKNGKRTEHPRAQVHKSMAERQDSWAVERWFEVTAFFNAEGIQPLANVYQSRMFVLGKVDDIMIVHFPQNADPKNIAPVIEELQNAGVRALAFSDNVQFVKLKQCSRAASLVLDQYNRDKPGSNGVIHVHQPPAEPQRPHDGSGVPVAGAGDHGARSEAESGQAVEDGADSDGEERQKAGGEES